MATRKIALLVLLLLGGHLYAQPSPEVNATETRRKQKLEWRADENVLEYKVEVQNEAGKVLVSEVTEKSNIQFSLPAGNYTYKITAYDMLGRESVNTGWIPFEIITHQEEARRARLAKEKAEKERLEKERLEKEIAEKKRLEEERLEAERIAREKEEAERREYERLKKLVEENPLSPVTSMKSKSHTEPDFFSSVVIDYGDEEEEEEGKKTRPDWDRKFMLSGGIGVPFAIIDEDFFKTYFTNPFVLTPNVRLDILPFHKEKWRLGVEVAGSYAQFKNQNNQFNLSLDMYSMDAFAVYRHTLMNQKIWWQIRAGAGLTLMKRQLTFTNPYAEHENSLQGFAYINATGGLSVLFCPGRWFAFEVGADYCHIFIPNMNTGFIYPYVNVGLRF